MSEYYAKNREKILAKNAEWRAKNKERHLERARAYHHENREALLPKKRAYSLRTRDQRSAKLRLRKYGLSHAEYEAMLAAQDGKCAICGEKGKLVVDHNHQTDAVRSLLCSPCNTAIGLFKEDTDRMKAAIQYLDSAA